MQSNEPHQAALCASVECCAAALQRRIDKQIHDHLLKRITVYRVSGSHLLQPSTERCVRAIAVVAVVVIQDFLGNVRHTLFLH